MWVPKPGLEAFQRWLNSSTPVITLTFVAGLAQPDYLLEAEAVAIKPRL